MLQVVWVDMLTPREFEQGFGSHTPMFTGQTKTVRYHMNFERAFALQKEVRQGRHSQGATLMCYPAVMAALMLGSMKLPSLTLATGHLQVLLRTGHAVNSDNQPIVCNSTWQIKAIHSATSAVDMYKVLSYVNTACTAAPSIPVSARWV